MLDSDLFFLPFYLLFGFLFTLLFLLLPFLLLLFLYLCCQFHVLALDGPDFFNPHVFFSFCSFSDMWFYSAERVKNKRPYW